MAGQLIGQQTDGQLQVVQLDVELRSALVFRRCGFPFCFFVGLFVCLFVCLLVGFFFGFFASAVLDFCFSFLVLFFFIYLPSLYRVSGGARGCCCC